MCKHIFYTVYVYIYSNYTIYKHIYLMSTCLHPKTARKRPGNGQDATTLSSDILLWRACAFAAACSRIEPPPLEQKSGLKNEGNNIALKKQTARKTSWNPPERGRLWGTPLSNKKNMGKQSASRTLG